VGLVQQKTESPNQNDDPDLISQVELNDLKKIEIHPQHVGQGNGRAQEHQVDRKHDPPGEDDAGVAEDYGFE
jgi:hypothetical protein